jgi:uncharacterized membrane protein YdjX (TVP38/TMEM64 family)
LVSGSPTIVRLAAIGAVLGAAALRLETISLVAVIGGVAAIAVGKTWQWQRGRSTKEK